jgi:hypothetical protein
LLSVLKINKPIAGNEIASRCTDVIRGNKKPEVVELTSNIAELLGFVVPIPT